jgi:tRNA(fMet)-specific endonuclease VapC
LTEYQQGTSPAALQLKKRLIDSDDAYVTTIISAEENMRGWMAAIRRIKDPRRQVNSYTKLRQLFRFFATWVVLDWDEISATHLEQLRRDKVRIGTMDLKIASICLARDGTLLSRNRKDFDKVPGLRVDDWMS